MLSENHGKIIEESQHEHLKEVHEHEQLKVSVGQDLPHQRPQHGEGTGCVMGILAIRPQTARFRNFTIKAAHAVETCVEHAATAQNGNEH